MIATSNPATGEAGSRSLTDYQKIRELTENDHKDFMSDLEIFDLLNPNAPYSLERCLHMQTLIRMLSRNRRSVQTARTFIDAIFTVRDVELLSGDGIK